MNDYVDEKKKSNFMNKRKIYIYIYTLFLLPCNLLFLQLLKTGRKKKKAESAVMSNIKPTITRSSKDTHAHKKKKKEEIQT